VGSSAIHLLLNRWEASLYVQNIMANFRAEVYRALLAGLYPEATLIYMRNLTKFWLL
jgi:hypothetical protein